MKPIINISDLTLEPNPFPPPKNAKRTFGGKIARVSPLTGAKKLGYNYAVLEPGASIYPFHAHKVNEELFFILEGNGEVRLDDETHPIKEGDFISCLPGGPAHQIVNSGTADLKYLSISTVEYPEIAEYPDSEKFGVLSPDFRFLGRADQSLGYWDGE